MKPRRPYTRKFLKILKKNPLFCPNKSNKVYGLLNFSSSEIETELDRVKLSIGLEMVTCAKFIFISGKQFFILLRFIHIFILSKMSTWWRKRCSIVIKTMFPSFTRPKRLQGRFTNWTCALNGRYVPNSLLIGQRCHTLVQLWITPSEIFPTFTYKLVRKSPSKLYHCRVIELISIWKPF